MSVEYDATMALGPQTREQLVEGTCTAGGFFLGEKTTEAEHQHKMSASLMRAFSTGSTRSSDVGKNDYEGFLNPLVIQAFGNYMTTHRTQADGSIRASDNWQLGQGQDVYIKSLWRHFHQLWMLQRGYPVTDEGHLVTKEEACCAVMFNVMGFLLEELKQS